MKHQRGISKTLFILMIFLFLINKALKYCMSLHHMTCVKKALFQATMPKYVCLVFFLIFHQDTFGKDYLTLFFTNQKIMIIFHAFIEKQSCLKLFQRGKKKKKVEHISHLAIN